jgi:putative chitinase
MIPITTTQLKHLAPNARSNYLEAFAGADAVLASYGINDNRLRLAHFMAQVLHECGGLTVYTEDMNYSAKRIRQVWPSRFASVAAAKPYQHNPEKLANKVYGGRMGNTKPGDGFRFIGHGLLQITGRESYEKYGQALGFDLAGNSDLAFSPEWALKIACAEWKASGCNARADADSIRKVTFAINGGYTGLAEREEWLKRTKHVWS